MKQQAVFPGCVEPILRRAVGTEIGTGECQRDPVGFWEPSYGV